MKVTVRDAMRGALAGKTIGRVLFNHTVKERSKDLHGRVLDLAGGKSPSYLPLLPKGIELVRTDLVAAPGVTSVDINEPLPFPDASFDAVLLFSALYAVDDPSALAREVRRVLKPGGIWYIMSPFIANEMPEPHDYLRFTAEGLERLCKRANFSDVSIVRIGERASAATQLMHPFFLLNIFRVVIFPIALMLDRAIPQRVKEQHPTPLSYLVEAKKNTF